MRPNIHLQTESVTIWHGDSIETMRELPDNSIDSIVTDPPYGLGFMGKAWDALPPGEEWAAECLRVLKPGGHLLAFGGSRTWHRLAVAVEDAGFEIRDSIFWLYGSGFPKHRAALKPACEPVVMGRKPFKGSLTANEAEHGTGALHIDATRIGTGDDRVSGGATGKRVNADDGYMGGWSEATEGRDRPTGGRWPANVVLDDTTAHLLDQQSGNSPSNFRRNKGLQTSGQAGGLAGADPNFKAGTDGPRGVDDSGGASRFFYVAKAPKRERPVVDGVAHPTVKPLALMRWLVKLVTPPGGVVLDPFEGSGTTLEACLLEGFAHVGIEREQDYLPLIAARLDRQAGTLPTAA